MGRFGLASGRRTNHPETTLCNHPTTLRARQVRCQFQRTQAHAYDAYLWAVARFHQLHVLANSARVIAAERQVDHAPLTSPSPRSRKWRPSSPINLGTVFCTKLQVPRNHMDPLTTRTSPLPSRHPCKLQHLLMPLAHGYCHQLLLQAMLIHYLHLHHRLPSHQLLRLSNPVSRHKCHLYGKQSLKGHLNLR